MKPTWSKTYGVRASGTLRRRNVDMKVEDKYLVPVEKQYSKEQMKRIVNACRFTQMIKGREQRWNE